MKYAVMASLSLDTPAKRNKLADEILAKIGAKPVWGEKTINKGTDHDGNPETSLEVRFDQKADMDEVFAFIKQKMTTLPVLKGEVSIHPCFHDEIPPKSCVISDRYIK